MTIKESWSPSDYLALAIATCGVGYLPLMPGTFGSLVGVAIFLLLTRIVGGNILFVATLGSILVFTFAGIWAGSRTEELAGRKDPGKIVVDEVAGQLIALFPLAFLPWSMKTVIVSFILFRFFDIVKPYPANRLQELHGGVGVMCDDLVAGGYAAVVVSVLIKTVFKERAMEPEKSIRKGATSKETLEDLEENQSSVKDESDDSTLPSPDGTFDESSELTDADPV